MQGLIWASGIARRPSPLLFLIFPLLFMGLLQMLLQVIGPGEELIAVLARMAFLACVCVLMALQVLISLEATSTYAANMLALVDRRGRNMSPGGISKKVRRLIIICLRESSRGGLVLGVGIALVVVIVWLHVRHDRRRIFLALLR